MVTISYKIDGLANFTAIYFDVPDADWLSIFWVNFFIKLKNGDISSVAIIL